MQRTISAMVGKGSVNHNSRKFRAENVDGTRTHLNIDYCNENIKTVYHELFDEALERYNAKQIRSDRKIKDYYEKIRSSKQEKPFHEIILQVGGKGNMNADTENGELAKQILDEYYQGFQERNPQLRVFSAHLHMDEATPHLHIDFVPFTTGSKRGLDTRVSLKQALATQGFKGGSRGDTEWSQWIQSEKEQLAAVMERYGIEWEHLGTHEKHLSRVTEGCTGIRRSTGQHPGGIVVLPHGHDINEFTPVQHPANDMECGITTTHFDYHSIDHNLLKLDILGHDDPTMIRTLEDYITSDAMENEYNADHPFIATEIPLDDKDVIELFHGTEVLGIKPEDIDGCKIGSLGIPEFGTDFVIQMVQDTKPQTLSDLIRISGLSHGTNVWLGNAQELVKSGKATISTAICTRDDIMIYLINKGVESALAFTIMESVRKGKGLKPEWEEAMKAQDVPDSQSLKREPQ